MHVTVNGARLYFDVEGVGLAAEDGRMMSRPTIILLHGGPGVDHAIHKPAFGALSEIAQLVYLDHRGNGRSAQSSPEHWTLAQWGDDVRGLCDALGIEKPIVIGTSFGGFVAQAYATRHADHVGGLVLVSTAAQMDFAEVFAAFERVGGPAARSAAEGYWLNPTSESRAHYRDVCVPLYSVTDAPEDWFSRVIIKDDVALHFNGPKNEHGRMDFREDLKRLTCPVLVMGGDSDPITPMIFSETIASHLPSGIGRLERFENAGHGLVADAPDRFFQVVRSFVEEIGGPE